MLEIIIRVPPFDQIVDEDGVVLLCLHHWGPSGLRGDHQYPSLSNPEQDKPGKGMLLWFVVDDFGDAWKRAQALGAPLEEPPNTDNGTFMRAFVIRDPEIQTGIMWRSMSPGSCFAWNQPVTNGRKTPRA